MGYLDLPSRWVYLWFDNGLVKNVANTDSLSKAEAEEFKREWEDWKKPLKVVRITLEGNHGNIYKDYEF